MKIQGWFVVSLLCGAVVTAQGPPSAAELNRALDEAVRRYDLAAATTALSEVRLARVSGADTAALRELHVRASVAVAELLRLEFEELGDGDPQERRVLGQRIDATAEEGLALLAELPESSDSQRMRADLVATMIRSDFRAKKFEPQLKRAVERALALDDGNARAWVSAAKPLLFAPPEQGRDLAEGIRLLDRALELAPNLESALLLRAYAHEQAGDVAAAERDRRSALRVNPDSRPALEGLGLTP